MYRFVVSAIVFDVVITPSHSLTLSRCRFHSNSALGRVVASVSVISLWVLCLHFFPSSNIPTFFFVAILTHALTHSLAHSLTFVRLQCSQLSNPIASHLKMNFNFYAIVAQCSHVLHPCSTCFGFSAFLLSQCVYIEVFVFLSFYIFCSLSIFFSLPVVVCRVHVFASDSNALINACNPYSN